jgi:hypothetical protein
VDLAETMVGFTGFCALATTAKFRAKLNETAAATIRICLEVPKTTISPQV